MITSNQNVYFLKFRNSSTKYFFQDERSLCKILDLPNAKHGMEKVCLFNGVNKFNYMKKKDLRRHFSWCTEVIDKLNKIRF